MMHSAQYLWITSYYARREAGNESSEKGRDWRPLAYFGVLMVGGIALFVPGTMAGQPGRFITTSRPVS